MAEKHSQPNTIFSTCNIQCSLLYVFLFFGGSSCGYCGVLLCLIICFSASLIGDQIGTSFFFAVYLINIGLIIRNLFFGPYRIGIDSRPDVQQ